jgi:hypothetical protein
MTATDAPGESMRRARPIQSNSSVVSVPICIFAVSQVGMPLEVDGVSFEDIEAQGMGEWLVALQEALRTRRYRPLPVRRVMIPKPGSDHSGYRRSETV